jgi:hypothetical protein
MFSRSSLKLQRKILPPSSGLKNMPSKKSERSRLQAELSVRLFFFS